MVSTGLRRFAKTVCEFSVLLGMLQQSRLAPIGSGARRRGVVRGVPFLQPADTAGLEVARWHFGGTITGATARRVEVSSRRSEAGAYTTWPPLSDSVAW